MEIEQVGSPSFSVWYSHGGGSDGVEKLRERFKTTVVAKNEGFGMWAGWVEYNIYLDENSCTLPYNSATYL